MKSTSHYLSFFFNDTATTEIYTLSLHDALPISPSACPAARTRARPGFLAFLPNAAHAPRRTEWISPSSAARRTRSEEHTSELQSHSDLVCRLLLENKMSICKAFVHPMLRR